ncbi:sensor histidine kinase [Pseudoalteromonas denitrificans]|nr:HAMP domain-containing sensor histidine kinase [Pseudoalteromonas denitrificans]
MLFMFLSYSHIFADLILKNSMSALAESMADTFYIEGNKVKQDDSELKLRWGFDALYSNFGYRLVHKKNNHVVLYSVPNNTEGYLFKGVSLDIPIQHSRLDESNMSLYREEIQFEGKAYFLDIARNDLIADFANEGIEPAIVNVAIGIITAAFFVFLVMSVLAIKLIIKPAKSLTQQIEMIKPDALKKRISLESVPQEFIPVVSSLNDALERVEESFSQQKRFIANAAHELRTPLTILLNRLELKFPASMEKDNLILDVHFISRIVEQLLDLSRAQNMEVKRKASVNLNDVTKNVCSHLAPAAIAKKQEFALDVTGDHLLAKADEGELTVVIKNIIENAIKHSPSNAQVKVTLADLILTIEDSGEGIPEHLRSKVFERFWRKNQSDRSGSGLGMAIIKETLSHYDASIRIDTSPQLGGTLFEIKFSQESDHF